MGLHSERRDDLFSRVLQFLFTRMMRMCSEAKNAMYAPGRRQCSVFADMTSRISPTSGLAPVFVEIRNLEDRQAQVWDEVNQVVLGRRTRHFESRVHGQGRRTGPDLGNLTGGNPWPARAFASDDLTRYAR